MRKGMAVITAFAIGLSDCSAYAATAAAQDKEDRTEGTGDIQDIHELGNGSPLEIDWEKAFQILNGNTSGDPEMRTGFLGAIESEETGDAEAQADEEHSKEKQEKTDGAEKKEDFGLESLQMPQKLEVTIDPWEIDGKGQVYSEQYAIRNMGVHPGILTLSNLTCKPREKSGVVVRTDREGMHGDGGKTIYMEMLFGNGERVVLTEEGEEYKTELKPGEEFTIQFAGEVNEYAAGEWGNGDVAVGAVYSWDRKEAADISGDTVKEAAEKAEAPQDTVKTEASGDALEEELETEKQGDMPANEPEGNASAENRQQQEEKTFSLDVPGEEEIRVDSWTEDGDGQVAAVYVMHNTGETAGILTLLNAECKMPGQSGISVKIKVDGNGEGSVCDTQEPEGEEKVQDTYAFGKEREKYVFIELAKDAPGALNDAQDGMEVSGYKVELNPGEEAAIVFYSRLSGDALETLKAGETMAAFKYSWVLEGKEQEEL